MGVSNIKTPQLSAASLDARDLGGIAFVPGDDWRGLSLSGVGRGDAREALLDEIEWRDARLGGVVWQGATWRDCRFATCDLSGAQLAKISVTRAEFCDCRARALLANQSDWCDIVFRNCNFSGAQFRHSCWKRARLENCDLSGSDWSGADARGLIFQDCDLSGADFNFCQLQGADWRTCQTENLSINAPSLRGLIVSPLQGAQFARVLGLDVRWV